MSDMKAMMVSAVLFGGWWFAILCTAIYTHEPPPIWMAYPIPPLFIGFVGCVAYTLWGVSKP